MVSGGESKGKRKKRKANCAEGEGTVGGGRPGERDRLGRTSVHKSEEARGDAAKGEEDREDEVWRMKIIKIKNDDK